MAQRDPREIYDMYMEQIRLAEEATTTGERVQHYHMAQSEYEFIEENVGEIYSSAELQRAARALQHIQVLVEGADTEG